jgi:hypothetical protein
VSLSQQLFCSFDGAAFLIRALGSPVQVCEDWGSVLGQSIVSPPWAVGHICGGPFNLLAPTCDPRTRFLFWDS